MTLLKDNNYKDINVALLSLEADIKNKVVGFDTSVISKQLAEINSRIDKINAGNNNSSAEINDIRYEIENINSRLNGNSVRIESIEQKLSDIFSAENKVTNFNTTTNSGIYYWVNDAANRPTDYGILLVNKYDGGDSASNLWINQVAYGTNNKIYFRQNINSGNWTEWKAVAFTTDTQLTLNGSNGASLSTYGSEPLTIGFPSGTSDGQSLGFDRNSIQAKANGATNTMYLNFYGGMVKVNEQNKSDGGLKVNNKLVIPIGAPSSLEDGCIWIER